MELLKQTKKDIVSKANIGMPQTFTKPLDYSVHLLVRQHPTLRTYSKQMESKETEPGYNLYPNKRERIEPKDEIMLSAVKKDEDVSLVKSLSKSLAGAFVN